MIDVVRRLDVSQVQKQSGPSITPYVRCEPTASSLILAILVSTLSVVAGCGDHEEYQLDVHDQWIPGEAVLCREEYESRVGAETHGAQAPRRTRSVRSVYVVRCDSVDDHGLPNLGGLFVLKWRSVDESGADTSLDGEAYKWSGGHWASFDGRPVSMTAQKWLRTTLLQRSATRSVRSDIPESPTVVGARWTRSSDSALQELLGPEWDHALMRGDDIDFQFESARDGEFGKELVIRFGTGSSASRSISRENGVNLRIDGWISFVANNPLVRREEFTTGRLTMSRDGEESVIDFQSDTAVAVITETLRSNDGHQRSPEAKDDRLNAPALSSSGK